jgi:TolB protein
MISGMPAARTLYSRRRFVVVSAAGTALAAAGPAARAQFRVDVTGVGMTQIPVALQAFRGDESSPQKIGAIVRADLERSGQIRHVDPGIAPGDENTRPDLSAARQKGVDALVSGSVSRLADGRYDVRFRLWDAVKGQDLGAQSFVVQPGDLRLAAHRVSDYVYEKLTGERGVFSTRICFITQNGSRYTLYVADADGENAQVALASPEPIISPVWSPSGQQLAYVSFESRKPVVYVHNVATGARRLLASFKGSNSAPAWSPDGRSLTLALSRDGASQLYRIDAGGGEPQRLTQSGAIDTEPVYTADGRQLYFVSDRGGAPQIYRMPAGGGGAERVTFQGSYNISPALSPDGRHLAYVSRVNGAFRLHVMELASGNVTALTDTGADESPSFAPNGKLIVYATQQGGRDALMTTTLDGRIKARLGGQSGDVREPDWGPFQKF